MNNVFPPSPTDDFDIFYRRRAFSLVSLFLYAFLYFLRSVRFQHSKNDWFAAYEVPTIAARLHLPRQPSPVLPRHNCQININAYWGVIVISFYLNISIYHCASCNTFSARHNIVSVRKNAATYSDLFHYPLSVNHTQKDLKPTENVIPIVCFKR
jgi:hypothetical protein